MDELSKFAPISCINWNEYGLHWQHRMRNREREREHSKIRTRFTLNWFDSNRFGSMFQLKLIAWEKNDTASFQLWQIFLVKNVSIWKNWLKFSISNSATKTLIIFQLQCTKFQIRIPYRWTQVLYSLIRHSIELSFHFIPAQHTEPFAHRSILSTWISF